MPVGDAYIPRRLLVQITAPHFCAAVTVNATGERRVQTTAPILQYMRAWTLDRVKEYSRGKGWRVVVMRP